MVEEHADAGGATDALLGGFCLMQASISIICAFFFIKLITAKFSWEASNIYHRLLLGLLLSDTILLGAVQLPLGVGACESRRGILGEYTCAASGIAYFVCDKSSAVIILAIGFAKYKELKGERIKGSGQLFNSVLFAIASFMAFSLAPIVVPSLRYGYDERFAVCLWAGKGPLEMDLAEPWTWLIGAIIPNLFISLAVGLVAWLLLTHIDKSGDESSKPIRIVVQKEKIVTITKPQPRLLRVRNPPSSPITGLGVAAQAKGRRGELARMQANVVELQNSNNLLIDNNNLASAKPAASATVKYRTRLRLRLTKGALGRNLGGLRTIALVVTIHCVINIPRWATLLLEWVLRVVFGLLATGSGLGMFCSVLMAFLRCSMTIGVLWWNLSSVRNLIGQSSDGLHQNNST